MRLLKPFLRGLTLAAAWLALVAAHPAASVIHGSRPPDGVPPAASDLQPASITTALGGATIAVVSKTAPTVEDERPTSGSLIGSDYPSIYARFNGGTSAVNPESVRITVDGADVTGSSTISSAYIAYTPTSPLQTGLHTVSIMGAADDGTPFSSSWSFRVDAGTSSDYTVGSYGGGMGYYGGGFGGYDGFGWPIRGFGNFGFFPPGFSVFTPGQLFFVSGGIIEVIFVSQFFPFGNAFFTISGLPGVFPLTPWLGFPGFFWGFARVPFGVTAHNAVIAARFTTPGGRRIVVHSTAPLQIEGQRRSLPPNIRYAVLPHLINHPRSPSHAVAFERVLPAHTRPGASSISRAPAMQTGTVHFAHTLPVISHSASFGSNAQPPVTHPALPIDIHSAPMVIHPVLRPQPDMLRLAPLLPALRFPMSGWGFAEPRRMTVPAMPARPR